MQFRQILGTMAVAAAIVLPLNAYAADPIKIGILIPGSKSDKGWMESGYDGLVASEKKYGDKIKVQMIENINYADMEQALTNLATSNALVIGVGGQTQAAVYKIAAPWSDGIFTELKTFGFACPDHIGAVNKRLAGTPYYDNVALWATRRQYIGITMNYRFAPEHAPF